MSIRALASLNHTFNGIYHQFIDSNGKVVVLGRSEGFGTPASALQRYNPGADAWTDLGGVAPQEQFPAAHAHDSSDRVYMVLGPVVNVAGAFHSIGSTDRGYYYDPTTDSWAEITRIPFITEYATSVPQNREEFWSTFDPSTGELWITGGFEDVNSAQDVTLGNIEGLSQYTHTNTVHYSGGSSGTWTQVLQRPDSGFSEDWSLINQFADPQPTPNDGLRRFYILSATLPAAHGYLFDPSSATFTSASFPPAYSGSNGFVQVFDSANKMYLLTLTGATAVGWDLYDPTTDTWSSKTVPTASAGILVMFGGNPYLMGTTDASNAPDGKIWQYTVATDTWNLQTEVMATPRHSVGLIADANGMYIIGGFESGGTHSVAVEYYSPAGLDPVGAGATPSGATRSFASIIGD